MDLENKVVLVTGASRGIGESICLKMLEKGANVYGTSRKECKNYPFDILILDVTKEEDCIRVVEKIIEKEGRIDIFINNAGAGVGGPIEDTDMKEMKWQFDVNFFGMMEMLLQILPLMRKQNSGKIILVSSAAGFVSVPYQSLYSASKYAVEAIGLALMNELTDFNIEIMLVNPGDTKTGFTEKRVFAKGANEDSVYYKNFKKSIEKMEKAEIEGMNPVIIANGIIRRLERKRLSVRYVPNYYKIVFILTKILPERLLLYLVKKIYL